MTSSSYGVDLQVVQDEILPYLQRFQPTRVRQLLQRAATRAGVAGEKAVRSAYDADTFPFSKTGNLRRSITHKRIRTGTIGMVVGPIGKKSNHRHLVEYGTKPHRQRSKRQIAAGVPEKAAASVGEILHPGARAHSWFSPARPMIEDAAADAAFQFYKEELLP